MGKGAIMLFVKGIIMLIVGAFLASQGLPSDETDAVILTGNAAMDALNQTANNPQVSKITSDAKDTFLMFGVLSMLIGFVELVASGIIAFRSLGSYGGNL